MKIISITDQAKDQTYVENHIGVGINMKLVEVLDSLRIRSSIKVSGETRILKVKRMAYSDVGLVYEVSESGLPIGENPYSSSLDVYLLIKTL